MDKSKIKQMFEREGYKEISEEEYYDSRFGGYEIKIITMNIMIFFAPKKQKYSSGNLEAEKEESKWVITKRVITKPYENLAEIDVLENDICYFGSQNIEDTIHINNIINQMKTDGVFENEGT